MEGDVIVMQDVFVFEQTGVESRARSWAAQADRHSPALRRAIRDGRHPPPAEHLRIAVLMLPIVIAGLAALAVLVIAIGISMSAGGGAVASRLERYASAGGGDAADRWRRASRPSSPGCSRVIERQDLATRLGDRPRPRRPEDAAGRVPASSGRVIAVRLRRRRVRHRLRLPGLPEHRRPGRHLPARPVLRPAGTSSAARPSASGVRRAAPGHDHAAGELAARRLVVPPGHRARHPRGASADQRGVRARRARHAAGHGPAAGAQQPRPPRRVRGPRADGDRHPDPEPGRRQPRHRPRLDRVHHPRADPDQGRDQRP